MSIDIPSNALFRLIKTEKKSSRDNQMVFECDMRYDKSSLKDIFMYSFGMTPISVHTQIYRNTKRVFFTIAEEDKKKIEQMSEKIDKQEDTPTEEVLKKFDG